MFKITLYEDARGRCPVNDFYSAIENSGGKNAKIQAQKIHFQLQLLRKLGTMGTNGGASKKLRNKIWELRPFPNRILFFHWKDNTYVLLHAFRKTTNQAPQEEIEQAEREMADWIRHHGQ